MDSCFLWRQQYPALSSCCIFHTDAAVDASIYTDCTQTHALLNTLSFFRAHKLTTCSRPLSHTHSSPPAVGLFGRYTHPSWTSLHGVDDRADDESSQMQMESQLPRSICRRGVCVSVCAFVCVWRVYPAGPWLEGSPVAC